MDARVSVSKDTISKAEKKLTTVHRGALLAERLAEVAESGKLSLARTRLDVASMVGYTSGQRASGYAWVKRMIKIGRLTEEFDSINKYGKAEYRCYYNPPKTKEVEVVKSETPLSELIKSGVTEQTIVEQAEPEPEAEPEAEPEVEHTENRTIVSIYHGETTVAIEGIGGEDLVAVIKAITN